MSRNEHGRRLPPVQQSLTDEALKFFHGNMLVKKLAEGERMDDMLSGIAEKVQKGVSLSPADALLISCVLDALREITAEQSGAPDSSLGVPVANSEELKERTREILQVKTHEVRGMAN